jgi:uncharacterized protein DUF3455
MRNRLSNSSNLSLRVALPLALSSLVAAGGCGDDGDPSSGSPDAGGSGVQCPALGPLVAPEVPTAIQPPTGATLVTRTYALGTQIYTCAQSETDGSYAWTFKAPAAELYNAECSLVGEHGAGPFWTWSPDGSTVNGKKVADAPAPVAGSIPWLLLEAVSNSGDGKFSDVTFVQRVDTGGGVAPADGCDANAEGNETAVPYSAVYYFWSGGVAE